MIRKKRIIPLICMFSFLFALCSSQNSSSTSQKIYGVRWFLGDHFTFSLDDNSDNTEYFVLMFNSDNEIKQELSVLISNNRFTCNSQFLNTQEETIHHPQLQNGSSSTNSTQQEDDDVVDSTFLHKCVVGNVRAIINNAKIKQVQFSVITDSLYITQSLSPTVDKYERKYIYNGTFRLPYYEEQLKAIVIGDWGQLTSIGKNKGYVEVMPCLLKIFEQNKEIILLIFTGDIAYDLQGPKYYSMLKYIEPITSKIAVIAAPGNHDTLYHADTFKLYTKSFYTPQWRQHQNYFNKIQIGRILFVFYNPELQAYNFTKSDRLMRNLTGTFITQFPEDTIKKIASDYFTVVVSHYPIYCSNIYDSADSCQENQARFKFYTNYFDKLKMGLYLSGHLHLYERSHQICRNGSIIKKDDSQYNGGCPLYVVEGAGGNDKFVQLEDQYPRKDFSASLVFNTGFGILSLQSSSQTSHIKKVQFKHYSSINCKASDHFKIDKLFTQSIPSASQPQKSNFQSQLRVLISISILSLFMFAITTLCLYVRRRFSNKNPLIKTNERTRENNHVEMVQENFEAPRTDKPENIQ